MSPITKDAKPPGRIQGGAIVKRYVKPEVSGKFTRVDWAREMPVLHSLFKLYPSLTFWTRHELGFPLNSMLWFKTAEGAARLQSDWAVFHLSLEPVAAPTVPVDTVTTTEDPLPYTPVPRRPTTLAGFLSPSHHGQTSR